MIRFIFLADTHIGCSEMGFCQQPGYPSKASDIMSALNRYLSNTEVDFVLHGGDLVDSCSVENISMAQKIFNFSAPTYLCLGNHDLTEPDSLTVWQDSKTSFLKDQKPFYTIETKKFLLHVMPNQWYDKPYYWPVKENCHFLGQQMEYLTSQLENHKDIIHLICTHSPIRGVSVEQTGLQQEFHAPDKPFADIFDTLRNRYKNLACVLTAHSHVNSYAREDDFHWISVSSLIEAPFEFKLFEIDENSINMKTESLIKFVDFEFEYNFEKTYVQGRPCDRSFVHLFNSHS